MNKLAYLDALKRAMTGLDPAVQAKTLGYYEQRFVDGVTAGRTEDDVAAELDDPRKIAMTLRASSHMAAFEQKRNPATFLRMAASGIGLLIFNLLMVVPAAVYLSLLVALYSLAFGFYIIGIAVTASGLAGANELVLNRPFGIVLSDDSDGSEQRAQTHVSISESGIHVFNEGRDDGARQDRRAGRRALVDSDAAMRAAHQAERAAEAAQRAAQQAGDSAERAGAKAAAAAEKAARAAMAAAGTPVDASADAAEAADAADAAEPASLADNGDSGRPRTADVIRRAERAAGRAIRITTDVDARSRTTQTAFGLVMVVGSILLFLLDLVITRYTFIGIKRYVQMNLSLLKGS